VADPTYDHPADKRASRILLALAIGAVALVLGVVVGSQLDDDGEHNDRLDPPAGFEETGTLPPAVGVLPETD
jgi:hypothetical protein